VNACSLLSIPFIALLIGVISRASFLLNSEVVNGNWLTGIGIALGCVVAFLIGFARHRARQADRLNVSYPYRDRWFKRLVNWPLVVVMAVFGAMIAVTFANRAASAGPSTQAAYTVTGFGSQRAGSRLQHYVALTDGSHDLKFKCDDTTRARLRVGEPVTVTMNRGLLGFSYVASIDPITKRAANW
jgi:hypothetical protein